MTTKFKITRFDPAQLSHALEQVSDKPLAQLEKKLAEKPGSGAASPFIDDLRETVDKRGVSTGRLSDTELKKLVATELLKIQKAIPQKAGSRSIDLREVGERFGTLAADLLKALDESGYIPGRLDVAGRVPMSRDLALRVAKIYEDLGQKATDAEVVKLMREELPDFKASTLEKLFLSYRDALPNRAELTKAREAGEMRPEAEKLAAVMQKTSARAEIVEAMHAAGYKAFYDDRIDVLRRKFPELVERQRGAYKSDAEYAAIAKKVKTIAAEKPELNLGELCDAAGIDRGTLRRVLEKHPMKLAGAKSGKKVMDRASPVMRAIILRELVDSSPFDKLTHIAERLSKNPVFKESFGVMAQTTLSAYVKDTLKDEILDWYTFQRQKVSRLLVGRILAAPEGTVLPTILEGIKKDLGQAPNKVYVYQTLGAEWRREPHLYPETAALKAKDGSFNWAGHGQKVKPELTPIAGTYDRAFAERLAWSFRQGLSTEDVVGATRVFDPKFGTKELDKLRRDFPELKLTTDAVKVDGATPGDPVAAIAAYKTAHPQADRKEICRALELRPSLVVATLKRLNAAARTPAGKYTADDEKRIATHVRATEPGETLADVRRRIAADPLFKGRAPSLTTLAKLSRIHVPEAGDWKLYSLDVTARALADTVAKNPHAESLSELVTLARKSHAKFPSFLALKTKVLPAFDKNLEALPVLKEFVAVGGGLDFVTPEARQGLTEELARKAAHAFKAAPPTQSDEEILATLHDEKGLRGRYPRLDMAVVAGLRRKFPDVIPVRVQPHDNAELKRDAERLSKAVAAQLEKNGKVRLVDIAREWGVSDTRLPPLMRAFPELFESYRRRYDFTPELAQTLGDLVRQMPMGTTWDDAAIRIERSGKLPPDMFVNGKTLQHAAARFPDVVPSIDQQNLERFEQVIAHEIYVTDPFYNLDHVFRILKERFPNMPVSWERFNAEVRPRWESWLKDPKARAPAWLKAIADGKSLPEQALGREPNTFPVPAPEVVRRRARGGVGRRPYQRSGKS